MFDLPKYFAQILSNNIPADSKIAVAVSGGADSLALVFLAHQYLQQQGHNLYAITIDHNLRPESAAEALWTNKLLTNHGINHQIITIKVADQGNRQAAARKGRYLALFNYCQQLKISYLMTAHQQDDNFETLLMRMMRTDLPLSWQGISLLRQENNINLIRPLLNISRPQLENYLKKYTPNCIDDPSNKNMIYSRIQMRQLLLTPELHQEITIIYKQITRFSALNYRLFALISSSYLHKYHAHQIILAPQFLNFARNYPNLAALFLFNLMLGFVLKPEKLRLKKIETLLQSLNAALLDPLLDPLLPKTAKSPAKKIKLSLASCYFTVQEQQIYITHHYPQAGPALNFIWEEKLKSLKNQQLV